MAEGVRKRGKTWSYYFDAAKVGGERKLKKVVSEPRKRLWMPELLLLLNIIIPAETLSQVRSDITVPYKEVMLLCAKETGEFLTPESFKYCARVIHYELGNVLFHSHCLRHTHGTILAENGVNPRTVMERLGHKDIETTLQTYTFNTDVMQQTAVDVFEKSLQA